MNRNALLARLDCTYYFTTIVSSSGCGGLRLLMRSKTHGLLLPIGEGTPAPLERSEAEITEPNGAHDELHNPDCGDHVVQLIALQTAVHFEAVAVKKTAVTTDWKM